METSIDIASAIRNNLKNSWSFKYVWPILSSNVQTVLEALQYVFKPNTKNFYYLMAEIGSAISSKRQSCRYCSMDAPHWRWLNRWRKSLTAITQECCEQYWTSPGYSTQQSSSCTVTNHPSRKLSKLDEPDTRDTAGEVRMSSWVMYSCEPLHRDEQRQEV